MIFQKKEKERTPYTITQCEQCNFESKKKFEKGDYVFKDSSTCSSCNGKTRILKIFGELSQQK